MRRTALFGLIVILTPFLARAGSGERLEVTGTNGWTATEILSSTDLARALPEWSALGTVRLVEAGAHQTMAETSTGGLYLRPLVESTSSFGVWTGVVHHDGAAFRTVLRERLSYGSGPPGSIGPLTGTKILAVCAVSAGASGLGIDDLLVARYDADAGTVSIVLYPAAPDRTPPVDTGDPDVLYTWGAGLLPRASVAADSSGNLYVAATGLLGPSGESLDGTIRMLTRDAGADGYSDSALVSGVARFVTVEGGRVYAVGGAGTSRDGEVLRIDPTTGGTTVFSSWSAGDRLSAWAFDATGRLRIDLRRSSPATGYVTEAPALGSASYDARIADVPTLSPSSLERRGAGGLYVAAATLTVVKERGRVTIDRLYDSVWRLVDTGSGGDGGSPGGGKGNGKKHGHRE